MTFFHAFGWKATLALLTATVAYVLIGVGLSLQLGWPEQYGLRCSGRGCLGLYLHYSPELLRHGTILDYLLFAWLWFLPVAGVGLIILGLWDARRRSRGLVYPSDSSKSE